MKTNMLWKKRAVRIGLVVLGVLVAGVASVLTGGRGSRSRLLERFANTQ